MFSYKGVASVKLNYEAEPIWAPMGGFFLNICCSFLALLPDVDGVDNLSCKDRSRNVW